MARRYVRDKRGRFAPKGYSGQTSGTGSRLTGKAGKTRKEGGAKMTAAAPSGTIGKPRGLKPGTVKPKQTVGNKVAASPRQLTKNEKIARDVMADKKFRSDRQRIAEMQRRGVSPNTDFAGLVSDARRKGGGTAGGAPISYANNKPKPASSIKATGNLPKPPKQNSIARTVGKFGPKNTIKPGPKSPRTKVAKGKESKGAKEKLQDLKGQVDALKGKMNARDRARAKKAFDKPSVTDKRSRDYSGKLTKEGRRQDPSTGGKKKRRRRR